MLAMSIAISSSKQYNVELVGPVRPNVSWRFKIPGGYDIVSSKELEHKKGDLSPR